MLRIENAFVADGIGREPFRASVLVDGGNILAVSREKLAGFSGSDTVDAKKMVLAPGFIDVHGHSDLSLLVAPEGQSKVSQGITTEIAGNCGLSAFPLTANNREHLSELYANYRRELDWSDYPSYCRRLRAAGIKMRLDCLCGHNTLRAAVAGYETKTLTGKQLDEMERLLDAALDSGAKGLSSGLLYIPGKFADDDEIVRLLKVVAAHGGVYATHLRSEGDRLLESLAETIECARRAGLKKLQISHLKTAGKANWGKLAAALSLIEYARRDGIDINVDRYPYTESMTQLSVILPPPWDDLGDAEIQQRLRSPEEKVRLTEALREYKAPGYWQSVRLAATDAPRYRDKCGRRFSELGDDPARTAVEILAADAPSSCGAFSGMCEENLKRILDLDYCMPGSDGNALPADGSLGRSHPRSFGAIAKFMRLRLDATGSVTEAVERAATLPARVFSLDDRGIVAPGYAADLVLFDPDEIDSPADFATPNATARGIALTVCRGKIVWRSCRMKPPRQNRIQNLQI